MLLTGHFSFVVVQDLTEDLETMGDHSQNEEGEEEDTSLTEPTDDNLMGKVETPEKTKEATVVPPQRRASTPPPPSLTNKLLTRLGSLDGE